MFEDETRQVPRCYDIRERYETSFCRQRQLSRRRRLIIAIELRVMLVIALTYHQHDIRHPITATVNLDFLAGNLKFYHLVGCQLIRINTERKPIDGHIQLRLVFLRQLMLHLSDCLVGEESPHRFLIIPDLCGRIIEKPSHHTAQQRPEGCRQHRGWFGKNYPLRLLFQPFTEDGP